MQSPSSSNGQRYLIQARDLEGGGVKAMQFASVPYTATKIAARMITAHPEQHVEIVDLWGGAVVLSVKASDELEEEEDPSCA